MSTRRYLPPPFLAFLFTLTTCLPAQAARPPFGFGDSYSLPAIPTSFVIGDYDEDGRDDVIALLAGGLIRQWHAAADGTLEPVAPPVTSGSPRSIAVLQVNGDSHLDLAIAVDSSPPEIDILLGNGDGTFTPTTPLATDTAVDLLRAGDLDGDSRLDLVGLSFSASLIRTWMNLGGTFGTRVDSPGPPGGYSFAIGDLDSDGKGDLAIAANISSPQSRPVRLMHGDGLGAFSPSFEFAFLGELACARIGDLDHDGKNDVVLGSNRGPLILWGDGAGGIDHADTLSATRGNSESQLAVADIDEDGWLDVVACRSGGYLFDGWILMFPGAPGRSFDPAVEHEFYPSEAPASYYGLELGDFNGDGDSDLVIGRGLGSSRQMLTVFHREGRLFEGVAEFSLDPATDTAAVARRGPLTPGQLIFSSASRLARLVPRPDGTLRNSDAVTIGPPGAFHLADLDGDKDDDMIVDEPGGVRVGLQTANGSFGPFTHIASGRWLAFADVDGDGDPDLVSENPPGTITVRANDGIGGFPIIMPGSSAVPITNVAWAAGDFNGDGLEDLAVTRNVAISGSTPDSLACLLSTGAGGFIVHSMSGILACAPALVCPSNNSYARDPLGLAATDLDSDGDLDLVSLSSEDQTGKFVSHLNDGAGHFTPTFNARGAIEEDGENLVVDDFDADGVSDVAATGMWAGSFTFAYLFGDDNGQFTTGHSFFTALAYARSLTSGDLDGDGMPELVGVSSEFSTVPNRLLVLYNATPRDAPTAVAISLISAATVGGTVRLEWAVLGSAQRPTLERADASQGWSSLGDVVIASGRIRYIDTDVSAGQTYRYRLATRDAGVLTYTPEVTVSVPAAARLALLSAKAIAGGAITVRFTAMPGTPVDIEVFDLGGRRLSAGTAAVDALGNGIVTLTGSSARAGVYWARVSQNESRATGRFAIVR